jgi:O-antigen/teichoic acid export membrane protein
VRAHLKHLTTSVAIYGAGDAAIQIVNFALLAVYVKGGFLTSLDYGALAIVGALEAFAKVMSRFGLDGAFMRFFHDRGDDLPRLSSTIAWFLVASNLLLLGAALVLTHWFGERLLGAGEYVRALQLMLANTALIALTFIPFHAMRMRSQAATYSAFAFARSVGTLVLRLVFVIALGLGLPGIYLADLAVTIVLVPLMWPWFRPYVRWVFSARDLRDALRFGLPRVPHGFAQQALEGGNKLLLGSYITQAQLGVYQNAVTLGTGIKFFTSAFETAWAPFYYATSRQPDAKVVFSKMTTYGVAVLVLLVAGVSAVAHDVVLVMLTPEYLEAASILPIVAVAMACHGVYLLTSIGLNLTSRTEFYPVATFTAAGVGLGAGVLLMPALGATGAAIALLLAYGTQAAVAFYFARRVYHIRYERGRIARVLLAGAASALIAGWLLPPMPSAAGLVIRAATTVVCFMVLLWTTGVLRPTERAFLVQVVGRLRRRPQRGPAVNHAD